jgi:hypothetical protein
MRRHTSLPLISAFAVALAATGCGSTQATRSPDPPPAPPIRTVNAPLPAQILSAIPEVTAIGPSCESDNSCGDDPYPLVTFLKKPRPRLIAELPLDWHASVKLYGMFIAYKSKERGWCVDVEALGRHGENAVSLHCLGDSNANPINVVTITAPDTHDGRLLGGTVDSRADLIRIQFAHGRMLDFSLIGPLIAKQPGQRVFMIDLASEGPPRHIALFRNGHQMASVP